MRPTSRRRGQWRMRLALSNGRRREQGGKGRIYVVWESPSREGLRMGRNEAASRALSRLRLRIGEPGDGSPLNAPRRQDGHICFNTGRVAELALSHGLPGQFALLPSCKLQDFPTASPSPERSPPPPPFSASRFALLTWSALVPSAGIQGGEGGGQQMRRGEGSWLRSSYFRSTRDSAVDR